MEQNSSRKLTAFGLEEKKRLTASNLEDHELKLLCEEHHDKDPEDIEYNLLFHRRMVAWLLDGWSDENWRIFQLERAMRKNIQDNMFNGEIENAVNNYGQSAPHQNPVITWHKVIDDGLCDEQGYNLRQHDLGELQPVKDPYHSNHVNVSFGNNIMNCSNEKDLAMLHQEQGIIHSQEETWSEERLGRSSLVEQENISFSCNRDRILEDQDARFVTQRPEFMRTLTDQSIICPESCIAQRHVVPDKSMEDTLLTSNSSINVQSKMNPCPYSNRISVDNKQTWSNGNRQLSIGLPQQKIDQADLNQKSVMAGQGDDVLNEVLREDELVSYNLVDQQHSSMYPSCTVSSEDEYVTFLQTSTENVSRVNEENVVYGLPTRHGWLDEGEEQGTFFRSQSTGNLTSRGSFLFEINNYSLDREIEELASDEEDQDTHHSKPAENGQEETKEQRLLLLSKVNEVQTQNSNFSSQQELLGEKVNCLGEEIKTRTANADESIFGNSRQLSGPCHQNLHHEIPAEDINCPVDPVDFQGQDSHFSSNRTLVENKQIFQVNRKMKSVPNNDDENNNNYDTQRDQSRSLTCQKDTQHKTQNENPWLQVDEEVLLKVRAEVPLRPHCVPPVKLNQDDIGSCCSDAACPNCTLSTSKLLFYERSLVIDGDLSPGIINVGSSTEESNESLLGYCLDAVPPQSPQLSEKVDDDIVSCKVENTVLSISKPEGTASDVKNTQVSQLRENGSDQDHKSSEISTPCLAGCDSDGPIWLRVDEDVSFKLIHASSYYCIPLSCQCKTAHTPTAQVLEGDSSNTSSMPMPDGILHHNISWQGEEGLVMQQQRTPNSHGQGGGQGKNRQGPGRKKVFEEYWSAQKVSDGIKRGHLVVGAIRINAKNYKEAYVPQLDGLADIFIDDLEDRNRALNSDDVVVLPYPLDKWRVSVEDFIAYKEAQSQKCQLDTQSSTVMADSCDSDDSGPDVIIESDSSESSPHKGNKEAGESQKMAGAKNTKGESSSQLETSLNQMSLLNDSPKKPGLTPGTPNPNQAFDSITPKTLTVAQMRQKFSHDPLANEVLGSKLEKLVTPVSVGTSFVARFLQVTGRVIFIYERKHSRAASGRIKVMADKNPSLALFAPLDSRVPRIIIPMADCPKGFMERPADYASTLFIARITSWEETSKMPRGNLTRSIGEAGHVEPETEAMLIEMDIDDTPFSDEVIACLPQDLPWSIPESEIASRRDLRSACIFTIDPPTARDLDDAMSCEYLGDGRYKIGVHIADVSFFVSEGTALDKVASQRATSVYLVQKVVPMLPRLLCEELCSLNPDEDRLTFSVEWTITDKGEILDEWYGRTVIRSCVKLSYDHAQGFIDQPDRKWKEEELPPISKPFTSEDIIKRVLMLNKVAVALRKERFDHGALRLDQVKLSYTLNKETGLPNGTFVYEQKDSNRLIEEFMLLANMAVAHRIKKCFPEIAILRRHPPPQNKPLQALEDLCDSLGVELNTSTAGSLQESLRKYYAQDEYSLARVQVLVAMISKPMQNARYFCTGTLPDEALYHHYALSVALYTHFTSPIRRYADVMVHRLLAAAQGYSQPPSTSVPELQKRASHCNDKKFNAKIASDQSSDMFFALYVKEVGQMEANGMVMAVLDKAFDVLILSFGVTKRVYLENLPILNSSFSKKHKSPELTLVWAADEKCSRRTHHLISLFTMVDCVIYGGKEPLKWSCKIQRPKTEIKFESE